MIKTKNKKYKINENAKPFYYKFDGDTAVLFIHAFTDSNGNFKNQIERLKDLKISCMGVRLPGHGTHYKDLANYGVRDWTKCVEDALLKLSKDYKNIYLIGFSFGGSMALYLARKYPDLVSKLVVVGAPYNIKKQNLIKFAIPLVSPFYKYHERKYPPQFKDVYLKNGSYDHFALKAVNQLIGLLEYLKVEIPKIKAPILIINIRKKKHLDLTSADHIYKTIGSEEKRLEEITGYYTEKSRNRAFDYAFDFLGYSDGSGDEEKKTIPSIFLDTAKRCSLKEALLCQKGSHYTSLTYKELLDEVFHLSLELKKMGIERGARVMLVSENRPEWLISDLAIMISGAVTVPANQVLTGKQLKSIAEEVEAKVIIVSSEDIYQKMKTAGLKGNFITMEKVENKDTIYFKDILREKPADFENIKQEILESVPDENDLATIVYTSGTTGRPKGIIHDTGGYATQTYWTCKWNFNLGPGEVMWCTADIG